MNHEIIKKKIERNYGLELLRMLLCYWVVLFHCLLKPDYDFIRIIKRKMFHVPCFFFISFYFLFQVVIGKDIKRMILRLERLLIPYFIWPICIWSFNNIGYCLFKKSRFGRFLPFIYLEKQLIIGRIFLEQFWFLFNLLFFTIAFFIMAFFFKKDNFLVLIQIIGIISYFFQYSQYNYIFFDNYSYCISHTIGHFVESFPIAATAFTLSELNILNIISSLRNSRLIIMFYSFIAVFFIFKYDIFMDIKKYGNTYSYNGIDKNIFSFLSFIGFYLIPINICHSEKLKIFIKLITNYTQGIYCIHLIVEYYLIRFLSVKHTVFGCTLIYICSYLISFLGAKLSRNTKIKYLFL